MKRFILLFFIFYMGVASTAYAAGDACTLKYAQACRDNPISKKEARQLGLELKEYCVIQGMMLCGLLPMD